MSGWVMSGECPVTEDVSIAACNESCGSKVQMTSLSMFEVCWFDVRDCSKLFHEEGDIDALGA